MAKKTNAPKELTELELIAEKLDQLAEEARGLGEEVVAKSITNSAKSARWNNNIRVAKVKRAGDIVSRMKAKGLTDAEIVAQLTAGK